MNRDNFWNDKIVLDFAKQLLKQRLEWAVLHDSALAPVPMKVLLDEFKASHSIGNEEWEIVSYRNKVLGTIYTAGNFSIDPLSDPMGIYEIFSVRRKRDGVVFTVGDEVDNGYRKDKIAGFIISSQYVGGLAFCWINSKDTPSSITNIQPLPQRTKLFTTEDGVPVYEDDRVWFVRIKFWDIDFYDFSRHGGIDDLKHYPDTCKYFSTEEKAKEYITQNKPLNLSMKEIASCVTNYIRKGDPFTYPPSPDKQTAVIDFQKLDELIKSKL